MESILRGYSVTPATWFYLSLLLIIAVYFRFSRLWSLRNIDLGLLLSTSPGLLLVEAGNVGDPTFRTVGYSWLFAVSALLLVRLLMDTVLTRRPQFAQNLNGAGMAFLCICTFVFLTAQAAARAMVAQDRGGSIITTASMSGHIINIPQEVGHYCTSKAAVIHLTKAMAVEFAPHRIRVNSVSPGYIMTELVEPLAEYHRLWEPKIPMRRIGRPEELSGLYLYLASAASSYMTGSDLVIDGGYCLP